MNAMSSTCSTGRAAWLAIAALLVTTSIFAAEADPKADAADQAATEKKLEDARRRLDAAAREVAELSMSMSEFSVPMSKPFIQLTRQRAMLGINLGPRGEELAEGVTVVSVSPGGAADSAGLKAGDVLLSINGKALKREGDTSPRELLLKQMHDVKPGDKVELRYRRDNKVATATIAARAPMDRMYGMGDGIAGRGGPLRSLAMVRAAGVLGSTELVPLTPKLGQYFGIDKGLLVVRAPTDSKLKLEDGDVIIDIDGRTPNDPTHAFRILSSYRPGEKLQLHVLRQKKRLTFDITVPNEPLASLMATPLMFHQELAPPEINIMREDGDVPFVAPAPPVPAVPPAPPGEGDVLFIRPDPGDNSA